MAPSSPSLSATTAQIPTVLEPMDIEDLSPLDSQSLPRADGGKQAWLALAGCFTLEMLVWGFPYAFGVFQDFYLTHEPFSSSPTGIAAIATTASGIMFLASPLVAIAIQRFPEWRRRASFAGIAVMAIALIAASFVSSTAALLGLQGVLYGVGGLTVYFPAMYICDEWFVKRKGIAFAVIWSGTGVAGAIVPFLSQWLLDSFGFRTTLRVWAVIIVALATPSVLIMRPRLPIVPSGSSSLRPIDLSFLRRAPFWIFSLGNVMQSIAYFLPQLWIPSFARQIGLPPLAGPLALCLFSLAAVGGYLSQGALVDRYHVTTAIFVATLGSVVSVFIFWGLTTSQPMLYVFVIIWGLTGGGYAANWSGVAMAIKQSGVHVETGLIISLMCVSKGIGSLVSGPISEQLLLAGGMSGSKGAYGTEYGAIILFTGICLAFGGIACVGRLAKWV
nr:hypothetical protein B0A51_00606 [Rachicladosporium sp. CCFEE 5018]